MSAQLDLAGERVASGPLHEGAVGLAEPPRQRHHRLHDRRREPLAQQIALAQGAVLEDVVQHREHVWGETDQRKTSVALLAQQHWGAELDAANITQNWSSTANSIEGTLSHAKDALVLIDELTPEGHRSDFDAKVAKAARIFRNVGNMVTRGRMRDPAAQ